MNEGNRTKYRSGQLSKLAHEIFLELHEILNAIRDIIGRRLIINDFVTRNAKGFIRVLLKDEDIVSAYAEE
jgi:hypothetical protein